MIFQKPVILQKPLIFRRRLARRVLQADEKREIYREFTAIGAEGVPRRIPGHTGSLSALSSLKRIHHNQVRLELRKTIGDKLMNTVKFLKRALHLEAVIKIEEEEQTPRIAAIRRDETEILIDSVNRLVQQISVGKNYNARSTDG